MEHNNPWAPKAGEFATYERQRFKHGLKEPPRRVLVIKVYNHGLCLVEFVGGARKAVKNQTLSAA